MPSVLGRFWSTDRSLTVLLVALGLTIFIVYPLDDLGLSTGLVPAVGFDEPRRIPNRRNATARLRVHGPVPCSRGFRNRLL